MGMRAETAAPAQGSPSGTTSHPRQWSRGVSSAFPRHWDIRAVAGAWVWAQRGTGAEGTQNACHGTLVLLSTLESKRFCDQTPLGSIEFLPHVVSSCKQLAQRLR